MPVLEACHDSIHPVGDDPAWSESWYFNAYDAEADAGFVTRIGLRANERVAHAFLLTWLPGGGVSWFEETTPLDELADGVIAVGGFSVEPVEAMRAWRLAAHGRDAAGRELAVAATFEASMPPFGIDAPSRDPAVGSAAATGALATGHFEQAGRYAGTIEVDGRPTAIAARGIRDKSWGPRRTDGSRGLRAWRWFSIVMGDDFQLGGIRVSSDRGELHRGWIRRGGEITTVRRWGLRTTTEEDGLTHRRVELEVADKLGGTLRLAGDVLRVAPVSIGESTGMTIFEGLARFRGAGRDGYGIAEYAHLLGADGRPVVPVD